MYLGVKQPPHALMIVDGNSDHFAGGDARSGKKLRE